MPQCMGGIGVTPKTCRQAAQPNPILPGPILPGPILPGPILPGPILPGPILPGPILPGAPHPTGARQHRVWVEVPMGTLPCPP
ncbi:hypothetical protein [Novosphingobium guangzhouense]|uniref:hypothetical protein n=1 Tax=Novosphingobium guangzhouense TaxID=1850347 RepID=UPI0011AEEDBE|nr:hypothetical protein [Novosphingobium guangzhouense]